MEFQFSAKWARFSKAAGGVIGQTLAMEGMFSFFLESTFLGLFIYGEKRLGPKLRWLSGVAAWLGSRLSGFFIIATGAWMRHPVGYTLGPKGEILLNSFTGLLSNPWILWQCAHNMIATVVTGRCVMAALGAYYLLVNNAADHARTLVRLGVTAGFAATLLLAFPTGDGQSGNVAKYQPPTLAAMEGLFQTSDSAPLAIVGQPDTEAGRIDNPIEVPHALGLPTTRNWKGRVKGLNEFPPDQWPDNIPLLYFSYHIMVGLGTILLAVLALAAVDLWRGRLFRHKPLLWALMLLFPAPYIAPLLAG